MIFVRIFPIGEMYFFDLGESIEGISQRFLLGESVEFE